MRVGHPDPGGNIGVQIQIPTVWDYNSQYGSLFLFGMLDRLYCQSAGVSTAIQIQIQRAHTTTLFSDSHTHA